MAKKQPTALSSQQQVVTLVKKPETLVGAVALTSLGVIGMNMFHLPSNLAIGTEPAAAEAVTVQATPVASPLVVAAPTSSPSATPKLAAIEKLANTSTGTVVIAQENDTFWSIAKRTCGRGVESYRIEEENGYSFRHLQPGDEIVVSCN